MARISTMVGFGFPQISIRISNGSTFLLLAGEMLRFFLYCAHIRLKSTSAGFFNFAKLRLRSPTS